MSAHVARAHVLIDCQRYDAAELELRGALASDPYDAVAHALLSFCQRQQEKLDEALDSARAAVRCAPDQPLGHLMVAEAHLARDALEPARAAVKEALKLDPTSAGAWGTLSAIHLDRREWQEGLDAAERGLQHDAEDLRCLNLRAMALTGLGRRDEAERTIGEALRKDPESALSHANSGWACLHRGDHRQALEHFREALRLEPDNEWARSGLVQAMNARYVVYRWLLRYFLWSARLGKAAGWAVVIGFYVLFRLLRLAAREMPEARLVLVPLMVLLGLFFLLTWIGVPLFNLLLRFNRFGRYALDDDERRASTWLAVLLVLAAGLGVTWSITRIDGTGLAAIVTALMVIPVTHALQVSGPEARRRLLAFAAGLGIVGAWCVAAGFGAAPLGDIAGLLFLVGFVAFQWIAIGRAIHR